MAPKYYAGHSMNWIERFKVSIPKESRLKQSIALCIAMALQHQYNCTKNIDIILNHSALAYFGVDSRCIRPYLLYFQQAGLIQVFFKRKAAPRVTLVSLPPRYSFMKRKEIIDKRI